MTRVPRGLEPLARYRPLVDDWAGFLDAQRRPLRATALVHRARIDPESLRDWLTALGVATERLSWLAGVVTAEDDARLGTSVPYRAGLFNIQEAIAMVPALLLDPRPGERVLDLCAAPGNKTAQLAMAMDGRGTVVAVDRFDGRLGLLRNTVERLGLANVVVVDADATSLRAGVGPFDRVLVDVPCSCEGTARKNPEVLHRLAHRPRGFRRTTQVALLEKAVRLCRPGGRIVYATCTYAPEENEAVVDHVRARLPKGTVAVCRAAVPGLRATGGLTAWRGRRFHGSMARALRFWPHHNDTGGFFVAVLEKRRALPNDPADAWQAPGETVDAEPFVTMLEARYGWPREAFEGIRLVRRKRHLVGWLHRDVVLPPGLEGYGLGLAFLHTDGRFPRPTTGAAQAFGHRAVLRAVDLDDDEVAPFVGGAELVRPVAGEDDGLVVVRTRGRALGFGQRRGPVVTSSLPKAWRAAVQTRDATDGRCLATGDHAPR